MPLPDGSRTLQEMFDQAERGTKLRRVATEPSAPRDSAIVYVRDNGAGKLQLCVRFPTGAVQVVATEP